MGRACSGVKKRIMLWDLKLRTVIRSLRGHTECVRWVAANWAVQRLLSIDDGGKIKVWDILKGPALQTIHGHDEGWGLAVDWSRCLLLSSGATKSGDATIRTWRLVVDPDARIETLEDGAPLCELFGHAAQITCLAVKPTMCPDTEEA